MSKTLPSLHNINAGQLQRLVGNGEVSESEGLKKCNPHDIQRYEEYGISKRQNIWAADSTTPFETIEDHLTRKELVLCGEWPHDDTAECNKLLDAQTFKNGLCRPNPMRTPACPF